MKKLLIILFLLALNSHAQVQENFYWEGISYKAQSTNYISKVITPLGDGLIQFDLITTGCVPGGGGGGHVGDCSLIFDKTHPGEVFRSQLYDKRALPTDQPLEFSFIFKDISEDDGLGFDGPGLTIFELYPTWTPTRMSFGGFPTHHIWYNPKDKTIEANIRWEDDNNPIGGDLSVLTPGWNNFIVQTNQTTKDDGYLRIIHNGKIIADYKGKTSYESPKGVNYIFGPYACCGFTKKGEPNHSFLFKDVNPSIGVGGYDNKLIIDTSDSKMIFSEALASVEESNAFDGSYWFELNKVNPEGAIFKDGYGTLLINDGEVTIKKGTEDGYNASGQMSRTFFDTFKGKVDKNGDIVASFYFSICGHCGLKEKSVLFSGNIKSQKLSGMYDDVEVIFDLKEKANIETSAFQNIAEAQSEESELFKDIKTSNTFDGYYGFTNMMPPTTPLGYGTLEINNGIVTISQGSGDLTPKYDSFEGRIDQNGDIVANFYFAPCRSCGLEDKLVVFEGNINKKKLSGKYNDKQIYFYLTNKKAEVGQQ
jgi:hypothetical protein